MYLSIRFQINIQMSDQKQWYHIHQKMSQDLKRKINAFCSEKISKHKLLEKGLKEELLEI